MNRQKRILGLSLSLWTAAWAQHGATSGGGGAPTNAALREDGSFALREDGSYALREG